MKPGFQPRRLAESADLGPLVARASTLEPPAGAKERILRALDNRFAPMAATSSDPIRELLAATRALEPPEGAKERILVALTEQALALDGAAEPSRLADSNGWPGALVARAAQLEPPAGRRARGLLRLTRPTPKRAIAWTLGGLATAAAMAVLVFVARPNVLHPGPNATPATAGALVGHVLTASSDAPVHEKVPGLGELYLVGKGARLTIEQVDASGIRVALEGGRIAVHADKRRHEAPLVVAARDVRVRIVGTIFSVDASRPAVEVSVREGLVQVRRAGEVSFVGAGESWSSSDGRTVVRAPPPWADGLMRTLAGDSARPAAHAQAILPKPEVRPLPEGGEVAAPHERRHVVRAPAALPASAPPMLPASPVAEVASHHIDLVDLSRDLMGKSTTELRAVAREAAQAATFGREAGALYAASRAADATAGDRTGALVQLAHLLDEELADPDEATVIWRHLAETSPGERAEARKNLLEIAAEAGRPGDVAKAFADCTRECAPDDLAVGRWTRALALSGTRLYAAALRQAKGAAPKAQHAAVVTYEERARKLQLNQLPRARRLVRFAAQLSPDGVDADLRILLDE